jgi:hypothetical protein
VVDGLRGLYCRYEDHFHRMFSKNNVKAVRLNCVADIEFMEYMGVEATLEPKFVLLTESEIPTPVADKIILPLIVHKVSPTVAWRDSRRPCRTIYYKAGILNPSHQSDHTRSLVLVRKDGKPLHPMHIHALFGYTAEKLKDPKLPENVCITAAMLLPTRIDHISEEGFQKYYTTMWQSCPIHDHFAPSPFDIQVDKDHEGADVNMKDD